MSPEFDPRKVLGVLVGIINFAAAFIILRYGLLLVIPCGMDGSTAFDRNSACGGYELVIAILLIFWSFVAWIVLAIINRLLAYYVKTDLDNSIYKIIVSILFIIRLFGVIMVVLFISMLNLVVLLT